MSSPPLNRETGAVSRPLKIQADDLSGDQVRALIALHLAGMQAHSPPDSVFALDLSGLQGPDVTVWSAWRGARITGICALKTLDPASGELKSMRTHPDFLRQGVAGALLSHIILQATRRGLTRLSLETGRGPAFEPALTLYRSRGFVDGGPFADYKANAFSQFLHLAL
jgi:putative acetyltransferase